MKAAVLTKLGSPLEIIGGIKIPELEFGQVLVKVYYSGVCHSQLMETRGKRGDDPWLPHMLGHEGSGEVIEVGEGVIKIKPGDNVILGWIKGEGIEAKGAKYKTKDDVVINSGGVTTFSNFTVVSENRLTIIPKGVPYDVAALYGCAIPTGSGIILNEISLKNSESIVIFGLGGIGISALMMANIFTPSLLIAIDIDNSKLKLAKSLGATHTINASLVDPVKSVLELTNGQGVDYSIEAAGLSSTISRAFEMVKKGGGKCIFASHPKHGEKVCVDPFELISGKQISGSWGGSTQPDKDIPRMSGLFQAAKTPLDSLLTKRYKLEQINEALDDLESGRIFRPLIVMEHDEDE